MKVISSFYTKPLLEGRWDNGNVFKSSMYMTALSLVYAHLWYDDIELFTDEVGLKIFQDFPIKKNLLTGEIEDDLWMQSKIEAMERVNKPFIHIDTDVFLKKKLFLDNSKPVILERREVGVFEKHYSDQVDWFSLLMHGDNLWVSDLKESVNCGTMGFNDLSVRDLFIGQFKKISSRYLSNKHLYTHLKERHFEPCIVMEQYNLRSIIEVLGLDVQYILEGNLFEEQRKEAVEKGYTHLFGNTKYKEMEKIKSRLLDIAPYWHMKVTDRLLSI